MDSRFVIHHLTDVHVGGLHYKPTRNISVAPAAEGNQNMVLYSDHLRTMSAESLPDLVVISGDLASYATEAEMDLAKDGIRTLVGILKTKPSAWRRSIAAPYVAMVPGNHDLDWTKSSHEARVERYARRAEDLYPEVISSVYRTSLPTSFDFGAEANVFIYLLDTTVLGGTQDPRLLDVHKRLADAHNSVPANGRGDEAKAALEQLLLEARRDPGYVDQQQLKRLAGAAAIPDTRVKIAVMHHNPTSVPSEDIDAHEVIINSGKVKQSLARAGFDMVLSGHRHVVHATREFIPINGGALSQEIRFLSGDTLGCKEDASFIEISLVDHVRAHLDAPPVTRVTAAHYRNIAQQYVAQSYPVLQGALSRPLDRLMSRLMVRLGREAEALNRQETLDAINLLLPELQLLQSRLVAWSDDASAWIKEFHIQLWQYHVIYATDVYRRRSTETPRYNIYLQEQYIARMQRLRAGDCKYLAFSRPVYDAILRTGWMPSELLWKTHPVRIAEGGENQLEIARILVRPTNDVRDRQILETMEFEHRVFAVPLFVLDPEHLGSEVPVDFAVGFGPRGRILKCYEYADANGKVKEVSLPRGEELSGFFERMLKNPHLKTVGQLLGQGVMIPDPEESVLFAKQYDQSRHASPQIVATLRRHFDKLSPRAVGVDVGCGTGNYTLPFMDDFSKVIGLDLSEEMLAVARNKSARPTWLRANAIDTGLETGSVDAVWMISTAHYFAWERQKVLFAEMRRILRPGGLMIVDTEFAEQHPSLWLVHFFPSLKDRYSGAIHETAAYARCLKEVGFTATAFETLRYSAEEGDAFLRIGQHEPGLYLDARIRSGMPAFKVMDAEERRAGLADLARSISDGTINQTIEEFERRASMPGDIGIIVARA